MPRKKSDNGGSAEPTDSPKDLSPDTEDPELVSGGDSFVDIDDRIQELFDGAPKGDRVVVTLYRSAPDRWNGENITGWLEELPLGLDQSYQQYIKDKYGGEAFRAILRVSGRFSKQVYIRIPNVPPRFPTVDLSPGPVALPVAPVDPSALGDDESYEGVSVGGTDRQFEERLARYATIGRILTPPPVPDINSALLEHLLRERNGPDLVGQVGDIAALIGSLKNLLPSVSGDGDVGVTGLIAKALDTIPEILSRQAVGSGVGPGAASCGPGVGPAAVPQVESAITPNEKEVAVPPQASLKEKAAYAARVIAECYLSETPERVVISRFDLELALEGADRQKLAPFQPVLFSQSQSVLMALVENDEDATRILSNFSLYFDEVFVLYIDPERKMASLE